MIFNDLPISESILRGIKRMNFTAATPVQSKAIRPMLDGKDIVVIAPTGSGKTAAFGIPVMESIDTQSDVVQALVLCPTRELALQIVEVFRDLTAYKREIRVQAVYGGEPIDRQIKALKNRPHIIVATPGRLIDHLGRRTIRLGQVGTAVLDEADRMLDMGFVHDMKLILSELPKERQTVMFSATMAPEVMHIAEQFQRHAETIRVGGEQKPVVSVTQYYAEVDTKEKEATLVELLNEKRYKIALVFISRKHLAKKLAATLQDNGFRAEALQGNMSQPARNRVMAGFKNGSIDILVATDVAARGIDVENIDVVVNYDMPQDPDSYIHRIGRTGRAGKYGDAYTLVAPSESYDFRSIVKKTNATVQLVTLSMSPSFQPRKRKPSPYTVTPAEPTTKIGEQLRKNKPAPAAKPATQAAAQKLNSDQNKRRRRRRSRTASAR
ncbi:MAG: DEAD/DEAH box helicase [Clostridiales Family XIII bacterium]|jgi:ATP-dependent RNA helicase DeaD|nr:DEAD/DEAH box helicase [Clostridiales Family XIII bacterium]